MGSVHATKTSALAEVEILRREAEQVATPAERGRPVVNFGIS